MNEKFRQDALKAHNQYRAKHGVPKLILNDKLCEVAQAWAAHIGEKGVMEHSTSSDYGENIYWSSEDPADVNGEEAVEDWYSEIKDFDWGTMKYHRRTGHFTQIIWKETVELGIAKAEGKDGTTYVVANYYPAGNVTGEYKNNIFPAK